MSAKIFPAYLRSDFSVGVSALIKAGRLNKRSRYLSTGTAVLRFDAHDFLPQARAAGAAAVLAERGVESSGLPGLQVADALAALQQLARGWRAGSDPFRVSQSVRKETYLSHLMARRHLS